ncbi:MAG TPA: hypothetical protein VJ829_01310, partial [Candidatus Binatia bacterium]|nr:hypothetical protein [Candidatus Binatia bacterium]
MDLTTRSKLVTVIVVLASGAISPAPTATAQAQTPSADGQLAAQIRADGSLTTVLRMAQGLVKSGLNAGEAYPSIWIRDLNTFLPIYLSSGGSPADARQAFLTLLAFQQPDGNVPDGYSPTQYAQASNSEMFSPLALGYVPFKNAVETDQESSLVQAVATYVKAIGDTSILSAPVVDQTVLQRLDGA